MQKNAKIFGMTLNEFWYGNPELFYFYQDCYVDEIKSKQMQENNFAWLQGGYFLQAFRQGLSEYFSKIKKEIYPIEPYNPKKENNEANANFEENMFNIYMAKANNINKKFKK